MLTAISDPPLKTRFFIENIPKRGHVFDHPEIAYPNTVGQQCARRVPQKGTSKSILLHPRGGPKSDALPAHVSPEQFQHPIQEGLENDLLGGPGQGELTCSKCTTVFKNNVPGSPDRSPNETSHGHLKKVVREYMRTNFAKKGTSKETPKRAQNSIPGGPQKRPPARRLGAQMAAHY